MIRPATAGRIPSLDGLRALSILLVIFGHFAGEAGSVLAPRWRALEHFILRGDFGVSVFFAISGFLITWLLLQEETRRGRIDLLAFYKRRAYRIWPAFYLMIAVAVALVLAGLIEIPWHDVVTAGTFVWNYVPPKGDGWWIGHSWSLAVEEQFYLLWPACLVLVGRRRALDVALAILVLAPVARVATWMLVPAARPYIGVMLHTRADALMVGCALALLLADPRTAGLVHRVVAWRLHIPALVFALLIEPMLRARFVGAYMLPFGWSLDALCITIVLAAAVTRPESGLGSVLNLPLLVAIGVRSYSLYLWQQFFAHEVPGLPGLPLPVRVLGMLVAAELSYRFIELPVLELRRRRDATQRAHAGAEAQTAGVG